jgi:hypothetical protein
VAYAGLALLAALLLAPGAEAQRRDYVGHVTSISAQSISVKDRRGNIASFTRAENTEVQGKAWDAIQQGDEVLVRWNLGSGIARQVVVLDSPPRSSPR